MSGSFPTDIKYSNGSSFSSLRLPLNNGGTGRYESGRSTANSGWTKLMTIPCGVYTNSDYTVIAASRNYGIVELKIQSSNSSVATSQNIDYFHIKSDWNIQTLTSHVCVHKNSSSNFDFYFYNESWDWWTIIQIEGFRTSAITFPDEQVTSLPSGVIYPVYDDIVVVSSTQPPSTGCCCLWIQT